MNVHDGEASRGTFVPPDGQDLPPPPTQAPVPL